MTVPSAMPWPLAFGDNTAEPLFHKGLQSCLLLMGQLTSVREEAVR